MPSAWPCSAAQGCPRTSGRSCIARKSWAAGSQSPSSARSTRSTSGAGPAPSTLVRELAGGDLTGIRVAAFGAALKPNSDDIRDAPALDVSATLARAGAQVHVYDPAAMADARGVHPELFYAASPMHVARGADVVVLMTEENEFRKIDTAALAAVVSRTHIVDGRHALDPEAWRAAGWTYRPLARPYHRGREVRHPARSVRPTTPGPPGRSARRTTSLEDLR